MIKSLRKRHLQIWSTLLVLLPVGIATAWLSVKRPVAATVLEPSAAQAFNKILLQAEGVNFLVRLRGNESGSQQLEWINKSVLAVPTAVIYKTRVGQNGIAGAQLIGRIEAQGTYCFPVQQNLIDKNAKFILYDFIHDQSIDSINFQP